MKQQHFAAARLCAYACQSRRAVSRLLPLVAISLFCVHCAAARAGDIARDTPAASMALAEGLYKASASSSSAAVSVVATPTVTATTLPSEPQPNKVSAPAPIPAPAPAVIATSLPSKAPETTGWISYVALIAGIVGAITGIAGAIMGALALRRASKR